MAGLSGQSRVPTAGVRSRRNFDNLSAVLEFIDPAEPIQVSGDGVFVLVLAADSGLEVVGGELSVQTAGVVSLGATGVQLNIGDGLENVAGDLAVALAADPGLEFVTGDLRAKVKASGGILRDGDGLSIVAGEIDHDSLLNYDIAQHRIINDAGTSAIELWSASKISTDLAGKLSLTGGTLTGDLIVDGADVHTDDLFISSFIWLQRPNQNQTIIFERTDASGPDDQTQCNFAFPFVSTANAFVRWMWDTETTGQAGFVVQDSEAAGNPDQHFLRSGPAGGDSWINRFWGNLGVGTHTPARTLHVDDVLRLEPTSEPTSPDAGDIYFDASTSKLRCHDGTNWQDLF